MTETESNMAESVLFFDQFFACNDKDISNMFVDELRLPKDIADLLKWFYIENLGEKEIAHKLNIDERTVRSRLAYARELCRMKAVFWLSHYFASRRTS